MELNSIFDEAMQVADEQIENAFASEFTLLLVTGTSLKVKAIFDAKLEPTEHGLYAAEEGALTVLNQRIDKKLVEGASVPTPLGERHVADVYYPDATTSILVLTVRGRGHYSGDFLK